MEEARRCRRRRHVPERQQFSCRAVTQLPQTDGIVAGLGYVWVANHDGDPTGSVAKIDPSSLSIVDTIPIGNQSTAGPRLNWRY